MQLYRYQVEFAQLLFQKTADTQALQLQQQDNLAIYRNTILTTHIRALKLTYPLISKLISEECFNVIAKRFAKNYPSRTSYLSNYGKEFSDFICKQSELKDLLYLKDIAQFEWSCHLIHQRSSQNATQSNLSFLFCSRFPLMQIIDLCHGQQSELLNLDLYTEEMYYTVTGSHQSTLIKQISRSEYLRKLISH